MLMRTLRRSNRLNFLKHYTFGKNFAKRHVGLARKRKTSQNKGSFASIKKRRKKSDGGFTSTEKGGTSANQKILRRKKEAPGNGGSLLCSKSAQGKG